MKTMTTAAWIATLTLALGLSSNAKDAGTGQDGQQRPRPTPEKLAAKMMEKFDANKDSALGQGELTKALEEMRANRPHREGGQASQGGEKPTPPPAAEVAKKMIENNASDKHALTESELAKALAAHRASRGQHGGGQRGGGSQGGTQGGAK